MTQADIPHRTSADLQHRAADEHVSYTTRNCEMAASVEQQQKKQHLRTLELQEVTTDMKDLSVGPSSVSSSSSSCSESAFLEPIHRGASATTTATTTTATPVLEPFIRNSSRNMANRTNDDVKKLAAAIPIPRGLPSGDQNHDGDDDDSDNNNNNQSQLHKNQHFRDKIQATLLYQDKVDAMAAACRAILHCLGEDPDREGLRDTPQRWAKALLFCTAGANMTPQQAVDGAVFPLELEDRQVDDELLNAPISTIAASPQRPYPQMVLVRDIEIHSLCEHHMLPFTGKVHIGYYPTDKILGLSKLARIAEVFARRLQVQERLTQQIAMAIVDAVHPLGVAVMMECRHYCMILRGVQQAHASTSTSFYRGCFEENPAQRMEFIQMIHHRTNASS